jgi:DNA-binding FrmR family transcriptional regulator
MGVWYINSQCKIPGGEEAEKIEKDGLTKVILLKRLRRVEGQVRGIQKMITEYRGCVVLVIQLVAIRSAIERVVL